MLSLDALGSRVSPGEYPFLPLTAGFPSSTPRRSHIVYFKDLDSVEYVMRWHRIACVITDPDFKTYDYLCETGLGQTRTSQFAALAAS